MRFDLDDVIVASATASGPGLRAIVRLSGLDALSVARSVFEPSDASLWPPRTTWRIAGELLPGRSMGSFSGWAFVWPSSRSFTRQPVVEFHFEAKAIWVDELIKACISHGARPAERGEFTLRAFLSGRIDLTRAEAVLGVIDARNDAELRAGLEQLAGGLSDPIHQLRDELLNVLADLEAGLDFVDEEIEFIEPEAVADSIERAIEQLRKIQNQVDRRTGLAAKPVVALVGPPNAGKSSLFNALLGQEQALVSAQRGTTRDHLESEWNCEGIACWLVDTAGLGEFMGLDAEELLAVEPSIDAIDALAQRQAHERLSTADLVLLCLPLATWESLGPAALEPLTSRLHLPREKMVLVATKSDLCSATSDKSRGEERAWFETSAQVRTGLDQLKRLVAGSLAERLQASGGVEATAERCRTALKGALESLHEALATVREGLGDELVAASLRLALQDLSMVTGEIATEDLLDRVFGRFCIGK